MTLDQLEGIAERLYGQPLKDPVSGQPTRIRRGQLFVKAWPVDGRVYSATDLLAGDLDFDLTELGCAC